MKSTKSYFSILFFAVFLIIFASWNSASANFASPQAKSDYPQIKLSANEVCESWAYASDTECPLSENTTQNFDIEPQQSKTGPSPSPSVLENDKNKVADSLKDILSEVTLTVPAYLWRHGCGPTALGMIVGYYDTQGFSDLIDGSSFSQTEEVNQMIASGGETGNPNPAGREEHYEDYATPQDYSPILRDDSYIAEGRTPHVDNSLADYMDTSKSTRNNYYGWSWSSDMGPAFIDYVISRNLSYQASYNFFYNNSLTWDVLTGEIDSGRPMVLLVDSDGNGSTDHFVTVIGYRTSPTLQYAVWDTWSATVVRWENFEYINPDVPWGIWGGWSFNIEGEVGINIFYVKPDVAGDCSNWDNACELQTALSLAQSGDQIWVAAGTYKPTTDTDRTATFQLKSGIAIYGGFVGTEAALSQRDWLSNVTILSGNIGNPEVSNDNSYRVVTGLDLSQNTILDGFTISDGRADGEWPLYLGAGMALETSSPTLENLIISNNHAGSYTGIYNNESSPLMRNISFINNVAEDSGGGIGNSYRSYPIMIDTVFIGNQAQTGSGGAMFNWYSAPIIINAVFTQNSANQGGAIHNESLASPTVTNATISNNSATTSGGGIGNWYMCNPILNNVTIKDNTAPIGAGIFMTEDGCPSGFCDNSVTLTNSIVWGNSPDQIYISDHNSVTATFSDIQFESPDSVFPGVGNINSDPLLGLLADNGGFTLTHALGENSPAIDAGNPDNCLFTDQRGFFRPVDGNGDGIAVCDIGAYEYGSTGPGISLFLPLILK